MDIRPRRRPDVQSGQLPVAPMVRPAGIVTNDSDTSRQTLPSPVVSIADVELPPIESLSPSGKSPRSLKRRWLLWAGIGLTAVIILAVAGGLTWYDRALSPVAPSDTAKTRITIESGSTPAGIAQLLHDKQLIHSTFAFDVYTRLEKNRNDLKAGCYMLSPSQSTQTITDTLVSGKAEQGAVTFFPGGTLVDNSDKPESEKTDVQTALKRAGFTQAEITQAFHATYNDLPLLADKPAGASLEGYVYGDTYAIDCSMTAEDVLRMSFKEYDQVLQENSLVEGFKKQGLTLHQGIIMASIVQSEMGSHQADMAQVAQIFLKRYRDGTPLGSDVTAYYGADLVGKPRAVSVDTPYNTRIHAGLPVGPISSPGLAALKAVANPAPGDYVYFLSGDDGKTYFATTNEQHERNIIDHCKIGCSIQ